MRVFAAVLATARHGIDFLFQVDEAMTPNVPPTNAFREGLFLSSAVEWLGPPDPADPDSAVETPPETELVLNDTVPDDVIVEAADVYVAEVAQGQEATIEPVDSQVQREASPAMVTAAVDTATLTAGQIVNHAGAALDMAARLDPRRVISLLA
jgi:hypothetical protein